MGELTVQRNLSSSMLLFERMAESTSLPGRRTYFELWRESLVWEEARRRRWFTSAHYERIHKVSPYDCNTAWCGRPVPPNGPVTWYESGELPRSKRHNLSSLVCPHCLSRGNRAGGLAALYAQIEEYQRKGREGVRRLWV